ncbi:MAG: hypothetical protein EB096_13195, partial [Betaproteobacteria bacterium]|nr:hypothetical protein [Betaproteobacteria bacterium]
MRLASHALTPQFMGWVLGAAWLASGAWAQTPVPTATPPTPGMATRTGAPNASSETTTLSIEQVLQEEHIILMPNSSSEFA